jgi:hypothetical protein
MTTLEKLIADLAGRAAPVRPLPPPAIRVLAWSGVAAAAGAAGVAVLGPRSDIAAALQQPVFVSTALLALATAIAAAAAAFVLAIPGAERSPVLRRLAVLMVGLWVATLAIAVVRANQGFGPAVDGHWLACFIRAIAVALIPAIVFAAMLRRAAPLQPRWTGALATTAAMAMGSVAVQIACPYDAPVHALLGHLGPVLVLGFLGARLGAPLVTARRSAT